MVRGEPGRVAERVRALLAEYGRPPTTEPIVGERSAPPATRRRLRLDPGRRGALAVGLAVVAAAVLTGVWVLAARPSTLPVSSRPPATSAASSSNAFGGPSSASSRSPAGSPVAGSSAAPSAVVVVDVAGKVRRPGLYRLPPGSRVDDAIRAAGGARPGVRLDGLNLAAKLVDGQQVAVGVAPAPDAGGDGAGGGGAGAGGADPGGGAAGGAPVNLNTATLEQLQTLPGVGPVLAQHVLDWRAAHGRFSSVDQLNDVSGIGDVKFAALKSLVTV